MLWPLGGMTFASPPPRPGAVLWTTAAGPLVHVLLTPFLVGLVFLGGSLGLKASQPDLQHYFFYMMLINLGLLVINILPIYPLDGGQMLRALLWFAMGPVRSLQVVSVLGFVGGGGVILLAIMLRDPLMGFFAGYMLLTCLGGLSQARLLARAASGPRRGGFSCPSCGAAPPVGPYWGCGKCRKTFDTFETRAVCPHCGTPFAVTSCINCGNASPIGQWIVLGPSSASPSANE
jgi:hypothetical protein